MGDKLIVQSKSKKMEKQKLNGAVIVALDFSTPRQALAFLDKNFHGESLFVKVGMELFYASYAVYGVNIIRELRERGCEIFLDLKLCDIETTVKKAMTALSLLDVAIINVHAFGGNKMMQAALEGFGTEGPRPLILAVTVLTSIDKQCLNEQLLVNCTVEKTVLTYAMNAKEAGLDGVICSAWEAEIIRKALGEDFLIITPGIRLLGDAKNDQKRVATPKFAREAGANAIVVGRSITEAEDPKAAYLRCVKEFS